MEIGTETKLEIRGLRILVADDHPAIRELLIELLEAEGALVEDRRKWTGSVDEVEGAV